MCLTTAEVEKRISEAMACSEPTRGLIASCLGICYRTLTNYEQGSYNGNPYRTKHSRNQIVSTADLEKVRAAVLKCRAKRQLNRGLLYT